MKTLSFLNLSGLNVWFLTSQSETKQRLGLVMKRLKKHSFKIYTDKFLLKEHLKKDAPDLLIVDHSIDVSDINEIYQSAEDVGKKDFLFVWSSDSVVVSFNGASLNEEPILEFIQNFKKCLCEVVVSTTSIEGDNLKISKWIKPGVLQEHLNQSPKVMVSSSRSFYERSTFIPLLETEIARCKSSQQSFCLGLMAWPEWSGENKKQEIFDLCSSVFRQSDPLFDLGPEGIAFIAFGCHRSGANVLEEKMRNRGLDQSALVIYPLDGENVYQLYESAKQKLRDKYKKRVDLWNSNERFAEITMNLLKDSKIFPRYFKNELELIRKWERQALPSDLLLVDLDAEMRFKELLINLKKLELLRVPVVGLKRDPLVKLNHDEAKSLGFHVILSHGSDRAELFQVLNSLLISRPKHWERKNPRAIIKVPARYRADQEAVLTSTFTLSREGIFLREVHPLQRDKLLKVEIHFGKDEEVVETEAKVIYSVPYFVGAKKVHIPGMACKFINLSKGQQSLLDAKINSAISTYII